MHYPYGMPRPSFAMRIKQHLADRGFTDIRIRREYNTRYGGCAWFGYARRPDGETTEVASEDCMADCARGLVEVPSPDGDSSAWFAAVPA